MTFQKGDFILIDYTGKVKETNEVFDTTYEEVSKKERLHKEGDMYEPRLVVIGEGWVLKALDDAILDMEPEKESTVEISPDKAFGQRDPEKIRRIPLRQLLANEINPVIGARIEYQGKTAMIRAVGAGRVLLDFNPPLAGRTLIYNVIVKKKLDSSEEKILSIIHRRVPVVEEEKFKVTLKTDNLTIDMPDDTYYVEGIQIAKRGIAMDIQKYLPNIMQTQFVETFKTEPKPVDIAPPTVQSANTPISDQVDDASAQTETVVADSAENAPATEEQKV
ncbi:MAG: peptidylprolyl isomerase [Candidatus Bathyarchaeota archaeon]|nr:peptidylprolyl isomerase [Candidatus Termiticorpusculum sp.]MCL1970872.1 peptidylprolyl isomerase [Candidatus Termiticorpusculum sp.]